MKLQLKLEEDDMYEERTYRQMTDKNRTKSFVVKYELSDLLISVDWSSYNINLPGLVLKYLMKLYKTINTYIIKNPTFYESLIPLKDSNSDIAIINDMLAAACIGGVGPMATIAGAISEYLGRFLIYDCNVHDVFIENGGDIFVYSQSRYIDTVIYCGDKAVLKSLNVHIKNFENTLGICTSSGKIGHSFSYGIADAVTIISSSAIVADAYATYFCNLIKTKNDIDKILKKINDYELILGIICVCDDNIGIFGQLELLSITSN